MLAALPIWLYIFLILTVYGYTIILLLSRAFGFNNLERVSWPILILLGLSTVNFLSAFLSLFLPLGLIANLIILLGAVLFSAQAIRFVRTAFTVRAETNSIISKLGILVLSLAFLLILENATHAPSNPDTDLYHAQAIRWIETYRVVPGLGNLHTRLAFNSNWLAVNALFSFSFLDFQSFHLLPGALFLLVILYFSSGFADFTHRSLRLSSLIKIFFLPVTFHIWASEISSPGTDMPASLLVWVTLTLWIEAQEKDKRIYKFICLLLAITAFTFKLSAFPLLLLPLYEWLKVLFSGSTKTATRIALMVIICIAPWLVRNFITSGYWLYPVPAMIPISPSVDWSIPPSTVYFELGGTQGWARYFTLKGAEEATSFLGWVPFWLSKHTLIQRVIILTSGMLLPFAGLITIFKQRTLSEVYICTYAGVLFWFFSVPNIRFGYGFLIMAMMLVLLPLLMFILKRVQLQPLSFVVGAQFVLTFYLVTMLVISFDSSNFKQRIFLPEDYHTFPTVRCELANAVIQCAEKYRLCSYYAFPCAVKGNPLVELRGDDWQDGFRIRQP